MKVSIHTFGCKVNQYETQLMRENFARHGHDLVTDEDSGIAVINSCCVTAKAEKECRRLVRKLQRAGKEVWLTGCWAARDRAGIAAAFPGLKVLGRDELLTGRWPKPARIITSFEEHARAFVKIEDGCENFCSYCIVPLVRGPVRSRPADDIIEEIRTLTGAGYKEVILTGIDLGAYGRDTGDRLAALLGRISDGPGPERIRISSLELCYLTDELIAVLAGSDLVCPHLHIPLQSGSDRILKAMNRRYTGREYLDTLARVRRAIPSVTFTTDVLVGFPGETEADFSETCRVVEEARFLKLHIFPYSLREGTAAAAFGDTVPPPVKKEREKRLAALSGQTGRLVRESFLGAVQPVLAEHSLEGHASSWMGYTPHYIPVIFEAADDMRNRIVPVRLEVLRGNGLCGTMETDCRVANNAPRNDCEQNPPTDVT